MTEIEDWYYKKLAELRSRCGIFLKDQKRCPAQRCLCSAIAECMSYHNSVLLHGYDAVEISAFDGHVNGNRTLDDHSVNIAATKIINFCFGNNSIHPKSSRGEMHRHSVMDSRFENGSNLIIYGPGAAPGKGKIGKTMLASFVMKEAIWRRMFKTNKAYTYLFKSCSEVVDDIISKRSSEQSVNPFNADWLCIDDVFLKTRVSQGNVLDQIMSVRTRENLPSIIVLQFDPFKIKDAEESVGNHIMKLLSDKANTFVVSLS